MPWGGRILPNHVLTPCLSSSPDLPFLHKAAVIQTCKLAETAYSSTLSTHKRQEMFSLLQVLAFAQLADHEGPSNLKVSHLSQNHRLKSALERKPLSYKKKAAD